MTHPAGSCFVVRLLSHLTCLIPVCSNYEPFDPSNPTPWAVGSWLESCDTIHVSRMRVTHVENVEENATANYLAASARRMATNASIIKTTHAARKMSR